jgi:hypothetical protein
MLAYFWPDIRIIFHIAAKLRPRIHKLIYICIYIYIFDSSIANNDDASFQDLSLNQRIFIWANVFGMLISKIYVVLIIF